MSLTHPLKATLIKLIQEHKVDVEVIPDDFYYHTFAYLLGGESVVLEGFPLDLSIALFDIFVLERAKCYEIEKLATLVFFGSDSRTVSRITSLKPPFLTTAVPTTSVVEVTAKHLTQLKERSASNLKDLSITLVLFQISADLVSVISLPASWQVIMIPLTALKGLYQNLSINLLRIAQGSDVINIERFNENLSSQSKNKTLNSQPADSTRNHSENTIDATALKAQLLCKDHGFPIDVNDVLLPSLIYTLMGENVILHTYSQVDLIHLAGILASVNQTGEYGNLIICIQGEGDRKNLKDFKPALQFHDSDLPGKLQRRTCNNFLLNARQFYNLKSSCVLNGSAGIIAILSCNKELNLLVANLPTNYKVLIGSSCYNSDLLKLMPNFRFVLFSGYPICPVRSVGYKADEFKLISLSKLPSIPWDKPTPVNGIGSFKPQVRAPRTKSKKTVAPSPDVPIYSQSRFRPEEHADILLTHLLQSNYNVLVQYSSAFDSDTYLRYLVSRVDTKCDTLQVIIHGDVLSVNSLFQQFASSNITHNCTVFCYCGGKLSSLKAMLISHKIQILFIPTHELLLFNASVDITYYCKLIMCVATEDSGSKQSLNELCSLHDVAELSTQIVLVVKNNSNFEYSFVYTPFCHVQESCFLAKKQYFVNFCNFYLR